MSSLVTVTSKQPPTSALAAVLLSDVAVESSGLGVCDLETPGIEGLGHNKLGHTRVGLDCGTAEECLGPEGHPSRGEGH